MHFLVRINDPDMLNEAIVIHLVCKAYSTPPSTYLFPQVHNPHDKFAIDREIWSIHNDWKMKLEQKAKNSSNSNESWENLNNW